MRQCILSGKYSSDGRLPGIRQLAVEYDCSPGTAANALRALSEEGLVRTMQGRGTFLTGSEKFCFQERSRIVGAVLLRSSWMEEMEKLRDDYLARGWFISPYCSSDDLQNPEGERRFLQLALEQNFAGVMLVGTPHQPLNTEFYRNLRRSGMKIIHLTYYQDDMSREAAILPDYRMAGALACSAAAIRGCTQIVIARNVLFLPPSSRLREGGVSDMAQALHLRRLPDIGLEIRNRECFLREESFSAFMKNSPDFSKTAILSDSCDFLKLLEQRMLSQGISREHQPWGISMADTHPSKHLFNHIHFDYRKSIELAMTYIMDRKIHPMKPFTQFLKPALYLLPDRKQK